MALLREQLSDRKDGRDKKSKRKKRIPLLPHDDNDSAASSEEEGRGLMAGARGTEAAERYRSSRAKYNKEFADQIQENLREALRKPTFSAELVELYAKEMVAVGTQKPLGYATALIAHVAASACRDPPDRVRLEALTAMMAIDQALLDGHWQVAWKLTGLNPPPFEEWKRQDVEALRREYTASRLALRRWVAAIGAEFKDEDILLRRRQALRPKGKSKGKDKDKEEG